MFREAQFDIAKNLLSCVCVEFKIIITEIKGTVNFVPLYFLYLGFILFHCVKRLGKLSLWNSTS